jgi:uncharacterized protein DUF3501
MLIEYPDAKERDDALRKLLGIEQHVWIVLGGRRENARFDLRQIAADRVSSVQFVRFPLGGLEAGEFITLADSGNASIDIAHPAMNAHAPIPSVLARLLTED